MNVVVLVMVLPFLCRFWEAALTALPIVFSLIVWYWGWEQSREWTRWAAMGFVGGAAVILGLEMWKRPVDGNAWISFGLWVLLPLALLVAAYLFRDTSVKKSNPLALVLGVLLRLLNPKKAGGGTEDL
jgi:hypothetical protein